MSMSKPVDYGRVCCPEHPHAELEEDDRAGDQICPECGLIVGDRVINVGVEFRTFSNSDEGGSKANPSRVGERPHPVLSTGTDSATFMGRAKGPAAFDEAGAANSRDRPTSPSAVRALMSVFKEIKLTTDRLNLPKGVSDEANNIFKVVQDEKLLRGRSHEAIASACVFIACRRIGVSRTFKGICAVSRISKQEIGLCFKVIIAELDPSKITSSRKFMVRYCPRLGLPYSVQTASTCIAERTFDLGIAAGRSPISVAAAAIYMASQATEVKRSMQEIGKVVGLAEATIRDSYKLMFPRAKELFPDGFEFCTPVDLLPRA